MSAANEVIFHVHTLFISFPAPWATWTLTVFWAARLYCQGIIYRRVLWQGKKFETAMHWLLTMVRAALTALFGLCAVRQSGRLDS